MFAVQFAIDIVKLNIFIAANFLTVPIRLYKSTHRSVR